MASKGIICLVKSQLLMVHSALSGSVLSSRVMILNPVIPTIIGTSGELLSKADAAVATTAKATVHHLSLRIKMRE